MKENIQIAEMTTMRLGGAARYVFEIEKYEDIVEAHRFAKEKGLAVFVLGEGANVIGRDEGYEGVVMVNRMRGVEVEEGVVRAMGGEVFDDLVRVSVEYGLSGIEALTSIPGTVGAGPVQNVGAYGQEFGDVIRVIRAYDFKTGESVELTREECGFGYRRSIFNYGVDMGRYFIYEVEIELAQATELAPPFYTSLQRYVDENGVVDFSPASIRRMVAEIRAEKLPDPAVEASAGSFFKNVIVDAAEEERLKSLGAPVFDEADRRVVPSGWLIEHSGLKGELIHGMRVSGKAALILINESAKSYEDLAAAREEIRRVVREKFGVSLEQEPVEMV